MLKHFVYFDLLTCYYHWIKGLLGSRTSKYHRQGTNILRATNLILCIAAVCLSVRALSVCVCFNKCIFLVLRGDARVSYYMLYGPYVCLRADNPPVLTSGLSHTRTDAKTIQYRVCSINIHLGILHNRIFEV